MFVLNKLEGISRRLMEVRQKDRTAALKDQLRKLVLPKEFRLPIRPDLVFKGIRVHSSKCMDSKKAPLKLEFASARPGGPA